MRRDDISAPIYVLCNNGSKICCKEIKRTLVYLLWPLYSTGAIIKWKSNMQKIQTQIACQATTCLNLVACSSLQDMTMHIQFFLSPQYETVGQWQQCGLVVKATARCWNFLQPLSHLCGTEPVSGLTLALLYYSQKLFPLETGQCSLLPTEFQ